ncbi:MAG: SMP-30/gluconolactonase/LRE family protein [Rhodospirillales bacterium]|nr:SMP-30/gluconolactonase/LRE family protein [Acetobacter sp.]
MRKLLFCLTLGFGTLLQGSPSVYQSRIADAQAVYLTKAGFGVQADGSADDTDALQAAIDKVQETRGEGILFVPSGRYRLTHTVYVWPGIRVVGYGAQRPVIVLANNTAGYASGVADLIFFAGYRPSDRRSAASAAFPGTAGVTAYHGPPSPPGPVPPTLTMPDANPGTFYSAWSNIDFEIGAGNAGAVAIRFHAAQHSFIAHVDFHLGSGLAGIHDAGNEAEDLHFYGGRYGILTRKPSPAWQFTLLDSTFEGQTEAAIRENEAGLTLVHDTFRDVPTAVAIDRGYSDELWLKDARFEHVHGPALIISNEASRLTEINAENVVCQDVPTFAKFRESGRVLAGKGEQYRVSRLSYGLTLRAEGATGVMQTRFEAEALTGLPAPLPDVVALPPAVSEWADVRSEGAKGDGKTDDTAALRAAIAKHRVLYVPMGKYLVTDTLTLRPDTVLIALHPDETQFVLPDRTPAFQGPGAPRALLQAPQGGTNMVLGLGLFTNGINSRAVGALWMAGAHSLMDDVRFLGGHGTNGLDDKRLNPYNNMHTGDPDVHRRWDSQYPSLWVLNGGGGVFANIWTPSTFAQAGFYVSDTATPGRVFELSAEHHVRVEIALKNVANWELDALQTEGEVGESAHAASLSLEGCRNLTIANYHGYRVVRSYEPFPYAVRVAHSEDIRFRNVHVDNNSSIGGCDEKGENCRQLVRAGKVGFANAIADETSHVETRDREFAVLDIPGRPADGVRAKSSSASSVLAKGASVQKMADGFFNVSGGAADREGNLFWTDPQRQRIYEWNVQAHDLTVVRDSPLDPVNLVFDRAGDLLVLSSGGATGSMYAFRPGSPDGDVTVLQRESASATGSSGATASSVEIAMPVDYWVNGDFSNTLNTADYEYVTLDEMFRRKMEQAKPYRYMSPDRSVAVPVNEPFLQGDSLTGFKWEDASMATGLVKAAPGQEVYVTNEAEQTTYRGKLGADGTLSDLQVFAHQGGESLAQDQAGNVYLAAGQIYVYGRDGKFVERIDVPERPTDLVFGGKDRHTLFVLSHHSVYAVQTRAPGL